jgi:hypothetical protein
VKVLRWTKGKEGKENIRLKVQKWSTSEVGKPRDASRKGYDGSEEFISAYLWSPSLGLFIQVAHLSHNNGCTNKMIQAHLRARLNLRLNLNITIAR